MALWVDGLIIDSARCGAASDEPMPCPRQLVFTPHVDDLQSDLLICLMRGVTRVHRKVSEVSDAMRVSFCGLRT